MYFDFEDHRPDTPTIPRPMSPREVVLITVILHLVVLVAILLGPQLPFVKASSKRGRPRLARAGSSGTRAAARNAAVRVRAAADGASGAAAAARRAVRHRSPGAVGRARAGSEQPAAVLARQHARAHRRRARPEARRRPPPAKPPPPQPQPQASPLPAPDGPNGFARSQEPQRPSNASSGILADAIRNVQKYAQKEGFVNLQGGQNQDFGPSIQFDTKGVEFGPWLRRFVAQIRRNWFIPMAAMSMRGHVVVTFYVHKDGRITDLHGRSSRRRSTRSRNSAFNAIAGVEPDACRCRPSTRTTRRSSPSRSTSTRTPARR